MNEHIVIANSCSDSGITVQFYNLPHPHPHFSFGLKLETPLAELAKSSTIILLAPEAQTRFLSR